LLDRKLSVEFSARVADLTTFTLLLGRLGRLNETLITAVCTEQGTSAAELRVLLFLSQQPHGAASPRHVARFVVQTTGGLTATLGRLEAAGLVERCPDPADGRGKIVSITPAGRALHARALTAVVDRTAQALADVDLDAVDGAVRSMVGALEDHAGLPSSRDFVAHPPETDVRTSA